jgi:uncharacterized RDD family membrane protein YckC
MTRLLTRLIALFFVLTMSFSAAQAGAAPRPPRQEDAPAPSTPAQPPARVEPPATAPAPPPPAFDPPFTRNSGQVVRFGQDYTLRAGEETEQVVVLFGSARIEGHVRGDVVVILGTADLASTAVVDGNCVSIAGATTVASGARVRGDFVVVGGSADTPDGFGPGGEQVVIGAFNAAPAMKAFLPWVTRGLLLGRVMVPSLGWVWAWAGIVLAVSIGLLLIFEHAAGAATTVLRVRPFSAFLAGLLVLVLAGPVIVILIASVVGIVIVPFALGALAIGWILGKIGAVRWIGARILPEGEDSGRASALRSFLLGFAVLLLAYMIPVLGLLTWATVSIFGLGAATLALLAAVRRENPIPPSPVVTGPSPTPGPAGPAPGVARAAPLHAASVDLPALSGTDFRQPESGGSAGAATAVASAAGSAAYTAPAGSMHVDPAGTLLLAMPHASFLERLAAFVLDMFLVWLVVTMLDVPYALGPGNRLYLLLLLAYHAGFWTWRGTTVGGIICQLRVVRTDGAPLQFGDALVRALGGLFSLAVFGLGGLWILRDPERQAWHDKIAGTYVVRVPRHWR